MCLLRLHQRLLPKRVSDKPPQLLKTRVCLIFCQCRFLKQIHYRNGFIPGCCQPSALGNLLRRNPQKTRHHGKSLARNGSERSLLPTLPRQGRRGPAGLPRAQTPPETPVSAGRRQLRANRSRLTLPAGTRSSPPPPQGPPLRPDYTSQDPLRAPPFPAAIGRPATSAERRLAAARVRPRVGRG